MIRRLLPALCACALLLGTGASAFAAAADAPDAPGRALPVISGQAAEKAAAPALPPRAPESPPPHNPSAQDSANPPASPPAEPPAAGAAAQSGMPDIDLSWAGYFQALAILCFGLALLWGVLWLVRRRGGAPFGLASPAGLRLESRLSLGPKKWILVLRFQDRRLIVGVTDQQFSLLSEMYVDEDGNGRPPLKADDAAGPGGGDAAREVSSGPLGRAFASLLKKEGDGA